MSFDALTAYLDSLDACGIPARDLSVWQDHRQIYRHMSGSADGEKRPVTARDIYWQYSTTKVVCCTAALRAVEDGLLSLDDCVEAYLPAFGKLRVQDGTQIRPAKTPLTIRHLMTMTGGLTYNWNTRPEMIALFENSQADIQDVAAAIASEPLSFEPGEDFQYGLCHDVLGLVLAAASGKTLGEYMREKIFAPLEMRDTGFFLSDAQSARLTTHFQYDSATKTTAPAPHPRPFAITPNFESGGGGMFSTVDDYIRFADALACGGHGFNGYSLLQPESIGYFTKNQLPAPLLERFQEKTGHWGNGYGLGVMTLMDPVPRHYRCPLGTFGWGGACGTKVYIDCQNHISVYFAMEVANGCNYSGYENHPHNRIINLLYGS